MKTPDTPWFRIIQNCKLHRIQTDCLASSRFLIWQNVSACLKFVKIRYSHFSGLDRNVYTDNLSGNEDAPNCEGGDATNQPGLKEMTLKAIDVLQTRATADNDAGWLIMSEAASIDKQMHTLDYVSHPLGEHVPGAIALSEF